MQQWIRLSGIFTQLLERIFLSYLLNRLNLFMSNMIALDLYGINVVHFWRFEDVIKVDLPLSFLFFGRGILCDYFESFLEINDCLLTVLKVSNRLPSRLIYRKSLPKYKVMSNILESTPLKYLLNFPLRTLALYVNHIVYEGMQNIIIVQITIFWASKQKNLSSAWINAFVGSATPSGYLSSRSPTICAYLSI